MSLLRAGAHETLQARMQESARVQRQSGSETMLGKALTRTSADIPPMVLRSEGCMLMWPGQCVALVSQACSLAQLLP
eukprot:12119746-Alexandrium_andersonii.AAC.2